MNKITVVMGSYLQNCLTEKEPIEWIVLKEEKHRCLCISKYLLDCRPYHDFRKKVAWHDCALRSWLNQEFLTSVFSAEERKKILLSTVKNPTENTQDYIFLLSADEVEELFDDEAEDYVDYEERSAMTTDYARTQGAWFLNEDGEERNKGTWWLRYYGDWYAKAEGKYDFLSCVNFDGYIEWAAESIDETDCCVRPVFWLQTD